MLKEPKTITLLGKERGCVRRGRYLHYPVELIGHKMDDCYPTANAYWRTRKGHWALWHGFCGNSCSPDQSHTYIFATKAEMLYADLDRIDKGETHYATIS